MLGKCNTVSGAISYQQGVQFNSFTLIPTHNQSLLQLRNETAIALYILMPTNTYFFQCFK